MLNACLFLTNGTNRDSYQGIL